MLRRMAARKTRRKKAEPSSQGLSPEQVIGEKPPGEVARLEELVAEAAARCSRATAIPRRKLAGARALPVASVRPTPFQRDLSSRTSSASRT